MSPLWRVVSDILICYDVVVNDSMRLEINGEMRSVPSPTNIRELLQFLGIGQERIAIELNRRIVRRKDWEMTPLSETDKVEIVQFVGGG